MGEVSANHQIRGGAAIASERNHAASHLCEARSGLEMQKAASRPPSAYPRGESGLLFTQTSRAYRRRLTTGCQIKENAATAKMRRRRRSGTMPRILDGLGRSRSDSLRLSLQHCDFEKHITNTLWGVPRPVTSRQRRLTIRRCPARCD